MDLHVISQNTAVEIAQLKKLMAESRSNNSDQLDNASLNELISFTQAQLVRKQEYAKQVALALLMKEKGDYGLCIDCDAEIPAGRLAINPASCLCVTCADIVELKQSQHLGNRRH